jgi:hypothetical protein
MVFSPEGRHMRYTIPTLALFAVMAASGVDAQQAGDAPAPAPVTTADTHDGDCSKKHKKLKKEKKKKEKQQEPEVDNSYLF